MKRLAIVPALNEELALPAVIAEIRFVDPEMDILVVDDGSRDMTAEVAVAAGARVARLPFNLGIGGAVQTGYRLAMDEGYDVAIQIDGDGQHRPHEIPSLLRAIEVERANYVIGSRFSGTPGYRPSRSRRSGILILSRLVSIVVGRPLTDTTSGFRAADRRAIEFFAAHYPHDYPEVEALVLAARSGLTMTEVPVAMRARATGRSSITPGRALYYMVKVMLAVLVQCMGRRPRPGDLG